jgi:hypothetical protein
MAVGQQWASNLLVCSRHLNSAPDGAYLRACSCAASSGAGQSVRTKKLSTLMQRRIADCVRKCSASTNGGDQERREADVQRNELVSMLTQWPAACLAFAGCGLAGLVRVMFDA